MKGKSEQTHGLAISQEKIGDPSITFDLKDHEKAIMLRVQFQKESWVSLSHICFSSFGHFCCFSFLIGKEDIYKKAPGKERVQPWYTLNAQSSSQG